MVGERVGIYVFPCKDFSSRNLGGQLPLCRLSHDRLLTIIRGWDADSQLNLQVLSQSHPRSARMHFVAILVKMRGRLCRF